MNGAGFGLIGLCGSVGVKAITAQVPTPPNIAPAKKLETGGFVSPLDADKLPSIDSP